MNPRQTVLFRLAKEKVASSNLVFRSIFMPAIPGNIEQ